MQWSTQLRYVLWKNGLLRLRAPKATAVEIVLGSVLFGILVWVRAREPIEYHPAATPAAFAMPSAGLVPYVQTLCCNGSHFPDSAHEQSVLDEVLGTLSDSGLNWAKLWRSLAIVVEVLELRSPAPECRGASAALESLHLAQDWRVPSGRSIAINQPQEKLERCPPS